MRHRQRAGLVLICVVLVGLAVVAGLRPHQVAGAGQAAPVPGPPTVGDCVSLDALLDDADGTAIAGTVPAYPTREIGACTGLRYGEVTYVIPAPQPTAVKSDGVNGSSYVDDPNHDTCAIKAAQYVGTTTTQPMQRFWYTFLQTQTSLSSPSPRQKAAGQKWTACLVTLRPPSSISGDPDPDPEQPRYKSTIRNAMHTGEQRDQLSSCSAAADWNGDPDISCQQPHAQELLAFGDIGDQPVARVQLETTCQQVVRQLTAMSDPTADGKLAIQTHVQGTTGTAITTIQVPAHASLACRVVTVGNRKLRGSLLALGESPVPWVS